MIDSLIIEEVDGIIALGTVGENCPHTCLEKLGNDMVAMRIDLSKFI